MCNAPLPTGRILVLAHGRDAKYLQQAQHLARGHYPPLLQLVCLQFSLCSGGQHLNTPSPFQIGCGLCGARRLVKRGAESLLALTLALECLLRLLEPRLQQGELTVQAKTHPSKPPLVLLVLSDLRDDEPNIAVGWIQFPHNLAGQEPDAAIEGG